MSLISFVTDIIDASNQKDKKIAQAEANAQVEIAKTMAEQKAKQEAAEKLSANMARPEIIKWVAISVGIVAIAIAVIFIFKSKK